MPTKASDTPARRRVLDTASALFYAEGVHTVGIDRIIAEAGVAKATFYHHFPAKDQLVRAYLEAEYERQRTAIEGIRAAAANAREALFDIFGALGANGAGPGFRGCPFTNAAAEYPSPAHPVRQTIANYRRWNHGLFHDILTAAGDPTPERTATMLMMLRDGIVVGSDLDDPNTLRPVIKDAVTRILDRAT
ncbi:TetR/AcrR family transcriptional regulator [Thermomonospora umbrina]|uniref:TetR family transcriptional regulator n=1 Tax=Thermomonospora umbrina TaxID=111806 RepID=A0A3D9T7S2_9ACTN|nr:TetR/AcrR family transcriptional regulator [Thermomonospora umbrina]REF00725.1 TetR family transcriptional regulator [Thermomonospora umbrina]